MTKREIIDHCLTYPAVYEDYPFDVTTALIRHSTNKKMFALVDFLNDKLQITLKCDPMKAEFLRQVFESVTPGYYTIPLCQDNFFTFLNGLHLSLAVKGRRKILSKCFSLTKYSPTLTAVYPKDNFEWLCEAVFFAKP